MRISDLIKQHRKSVSVITSLILIENIAWIIEPTLFGNLIDAFIEKASTKNLVIQLHHLTPLFLWIGAYFINSASGSIRRRFEPKVFQKIYVEIVTKVAEFGIKNNIDTSKTTARAQLSQEYVTFMQYRMPEIFEQTIAIGGAVIALTFYDMRIAGVCLLIAIPLTLLSNRYSKHVIDLQEDLHDNYEVAYGLFAEKNIEKIKATYTANAKIQEKIAKWGSLNFAVMRFILLIIFLFVLFIAIDMDYFSTGDIYSIVSYLWTFVTSVEYIPELLESKTSLQDLSKRLKMNY